MIQVYERNEEVRQIWRHPADGKFRIHWPKTGKVERLGIVAFDTGMDAFDALCQAYPNRSFRFEASSPRG